MLETEQVIFLIFTPCSDCSILILTLDLFSKDATAKQNLLELHNALYDTDETDPELIQQVGLEDRKDYSDKRPLQDNSCEYP